MVFGKAHAIDHGRNVANTQEKLLDNTQNSEIWLKILGCGIACEDDQKINNRRGLDPDVVFEPLTVLKKIPTRRGSYSQNDSFFKGF